MSLLGRIGGWFRGLGHRLSQSDEEFLADETEAWANEIDGTVRLRDVPLREPVRIAGVVSRITVVPSEGRRAIEALISDGTGEVTASWMGRTSIQGVVLGTRLVLEGVVAQTREGKRIVNPRYEFA